MSVAERRPLTIVFLDLVNSTGLAERLEPEDLLQTLQAYRRTCADTVRRYGGTVAQFMGDGVLATFCYPLAHDDDPERGVLAALDAVAATARLVAADGTVLAGRAGVATGSVVVGRLFAEDGAGNRDEASQIIGRPLNLAARLQAMARPGDVVVSAETASRLGHRVALEALTATVVPGFAAPITAYRALAPLQRRPGPGRSATAAAFVGRSGELALLHDRWQAALARQGSLAIVRGEAGIGKSRLVRQLAITRAARGASDSLTVSASPFHSDEPLHPAIIALRRLLRVDRARPTESVSRLPRLLGVARDQALGVPGLHALADLVGLDAGGTADVLADVAPAQLKELVLEALVTSVARFATRRPLLLVVEDAHWLDPTSLELIERLAAETPGQFLLLLTARESFTSPPGGPWRDATLVELPGLPEVDAARLLSQLAGRSIPTRADRALARRTGGVPLFVEEFARLIAEDRAGSDDTLAMPTTLHECLAAKLDRAGSAKIVAQAAAVIGSETFAPGFLSRVTGLDPARVRDALQELADAGVFRRADQDESWCFHHALLREAAYSSLLRNLRRTLHGRAAEVVAALGEHTLLAHHLIEAGRIDESLPHLLSSARRSLARSALLEAIRLLKRGLVALAALPDTPERREQRLELLVLLGPAVCSVDGPGSNDAQAIYTDAIELARSMPARPSHFAVYWGWWRVSRDYFVHGQRAAAILTDAQARGDADLVLQAHHCSWPTHLYRGDLAGCVSHVREGLRLYDPDRHPAMAAQFGNHDVKACGHGNRAQALWQCGRASAALADETRSLAWARRLGHVGTLAHALELATSHRLFRGDPAEVARVTDELAALADDNDFQDYQARCETLRGWMMAVGGDARAGALRASRGLARQHELGTPEDFPFLQCMVAAAWRLAGEPERALADLVTARDEFDRIGLRLWLPEVWRSIGDLELHVDGGALDAAQAAYLEAYQTAEAQGAHRLTLRAAIALARLAPQRGNAPEALATVAAARSRIEDVEPGAADIAAAEALIGAG